MKILKPKFEIIEQAPGMEGMLKHIELCGRTCYKSHDKITEDSAEKFVERMKSNQHFSVVEHGAVYLKLDNDLENALIIGKYASNKFSIVHHMMEQSYISTNYRVIVENGWEDDLKYQCEPTEHHERRVTVRFTTDIGISREFNRHRVNSISEQSTRYCNYSKDRFGGEISVVAPLSKRERIEDARKDYEWFHKDDMEAFCYMCDSVRTLAKNGEYDGSTESFDDIDTWLFANLAAQWSYMRLTEIFGWSAQDARSVLPLDTATELVHTAYVSDWEHFFGLRCDEHAHPMARELAIPLREEFVKRGFIKE